MRMTAASTARFALSCVLALAACASPAPTTPDGNSADASVSSDQSAPDATDDRPATSAPDAGPAVMDASDAAATEDVATEAATDASTGSSTDACVADGGDPSLRFAEVYRRTMNDGTGLGCTSSSRCHGRPGEYFDLSTESAAYASLLGVMGSCGVRVTPCDLGGSYLSRLMHNPDTCSGMRHTGTFQTMTPEQIALLDAWILGGARR